MSSTKRGGQRSPSDNYPTPKWCVHRFLKEYIPRVQSLTSGASRWLEPGAGEGNLVRAVNEYWPEGQYHWHLCEIRESCKPILENLGKVERVTIGSFLDYPEDPEDIDGGYDVSISNPPFSIAMEFIEKSMEIASSTAMLQRLNFVGSAKRHEFMKKHKPDIYVIPNRPSFKATGETDSIEYAWFVFDAFSKGRWELLDLTPVDVRKAEHKALVDLGYLHG